MKIVKKSIGFSIGVVIGAASVLTYSSWDQALNPTSFPVFERKGYTLVYDTRGKIPFWTQEHLIPENLQKNADRKDLSFYEDKQVYQPHRSILKDYHMSGFDRGHIVPAGDTTYSLEAMKETFALSNICPQHPECNRKIWRSLEQHIRELVRTEGPLDVVTGPLFLSHEENGKRFVTYQVIGESEVAVPTHFFKVIQTSKETLAYVIPNEPVTGELESFRFSVGSLEKISGIRFTR